MLLSSFQSIFAYIVPGLKRIRWVLFVFKVYNLPSLVDKTEADRFKNKNFTKVKRADKLKLVVYVILAKEPEFKFHEGRGIFCSFYHWYL